LHHSVAADNGEGSTFLQFPVLLLEVFIFKKIERRQQEVETELKMWDPHNDPNAQGDAFKTLFVARVNYD
ncbi:hypothetical protein, partial [Salmonella enterica]|uniref:hypothetical protein n=1 Tax=Salmonella enterica TaxID=28901 RepID=UPI0032979B7A